MREAGADMPEMTLTPEQLQQAAETEARVTTTVDIRPVLPRKRDALLSHASQSQESWMNKIPPELAEGVFGFEHFIRGADSTGAPVPEDGLFAGLHTTPINVHPVDDIYLDPASATPGGLPDADTYIAQWKGTFSTAAAGVTRFELQDCLGAILVIDPGTDHQQTAIYALSLAGDFDLSGSTDALDSFDLAYGGYYNDGLNTHTWTEGDLSGDQLATLLKLTERYCVVLQTLKQSPAVSVTSRIG